MEKHVIGPRQRLRDVHPLTAPHVELGVGGDDAFLQGGQATTGLKVEQGVKPLESASF